MNRDHDANGLLWTLGAIIAVAAFTLLFVFEPFIGAGVLVGAFFLWTFAWKVERFFAAHFALAVLTLMAVPILRLTQAENSLRFAVPAVLAATTVAVAVRIKAKPSKGLITLALLFFSLGAIATALVEDDNEWPFFAIEVLVAGAAFVLATGAAKLRAWPTVAKIIILATAAEAAIGIYEVLQLSEPIWRGGRILPDGKSTWIRNELIASIPRAQGTFGHPLPFAFTLIVGALLILRTKVFTGLVRFALFFLLAAGVFVSGSRNAIILFVVLSALAFILPSLIVRLPMLGTLALMGLAVAFPFLVEKFEELVNSGSVGHRLGALDAVSNLLDFRDLGTVLIGDGSASTPRLFSEGLLQTDGFNAVDNQYVLTLAQNGVLGLIVLIIVIVVAFRLASATLRVMLLAVMITAMIFDLFTWPAIGFFVWFLIASAYARMPGTNPPPKLTKPETPVSLGGSRGRHLVDYAQLVPAPPLIQSR
ncbi:hypothetical protein [Arthrobacter sp. ISL-30]|uniref:hypothetical protein n=1 Tax=Arthrobacter sp. ISL-30 TaxID=2819109 RepID=UPI001BE709A4|nr:hypothetical protein [Arthrobacter sp. ISL-30]MBT2515750.1 hypothetical protein [Arthrobacter sp. ISL-30]